MSRIKFLSIIFSVWIFVGCTPHRNSYEKVLLSHPIRSELFHTEVIYAEQFRKKASVFENVFSKVDDNVPEFNLAGYRNNSLSWLAITENGGVSAFRYYGVIDMSVQEFICYLSNAPRMDELFWMNELNIGHSSGFDFRYSFLLTEEDGYVPVDLYCVNASVAYPFDDLKLYKDILDQVVISVLSIRKKIYVKRSDGDI